MKTNVKLEMISGDYKGNVFDMKPGDKITFGRDSSVCQIVFDKNDVNISRKHCTISYDTVSGEIVVKNYSQNGTFVNRMNSLGPNEKATLLNGGLVTIGRTNNVVRCTWIEKANRQDMWTNNEPEVPRNRPVAPVAGMVYDS